MKTRLPSFVLAIVFALFIYLVRILYLLKLRFSGRCPSHNKIRCLCGIQIAVPLVVLVLLLTGGLAISLDAWIVVLSKTTTFCYSRPDGWIAEGRRVTRFVAAACE